MTILNSQQHVEHKNSCPLSRECTCIHCVERVEAEVKQLNREYAEEYNQRISFPMALLTAAIGQCPAIQMILDMGKLPEKYMEVEVKRKKYVPIEQKTTAEHNVRRAETVGHRRVCKPKMKIIRYKETITVRDNMAMLKGHVQSGKTNFMISLATALMASGETTMIILRRNCGDMYQIKKRIQQFNKIIQKSLRLMGFTGDSVPHQVQYIDSKFTQGQFESAIQGHPPKILVALGNPSQLKRINIGLDIMKNKDLPLNYNMFIDECDLMDSPETETARALEPLKYSANLVLNVSATILDNLMEQYIKKGRLFMLERPKGYRSILGFNRHIYIDEKSQPCNKKEHNPFTRDKYLEKFLRYLSGKNPYHLPAYNKQVPRMALINIGKVNAPQRKVFDWGKEKLGHRIAFILFNGEGLSAHHALLPTTPITIQTVNGPVTSTYEPLGKVHTFTKIPITDFYQYLKDNGGVERFPRIVTIAGNLACRGLSFVSGDYGQYLRDTAKRKSNPVIGWRTSYIYYLASKGTDQPELIQNVGRPCVIAPEGDVVPIVLISTEKTCKDVIKAVNLQEDLIKQALDRQEQYFRQSIPRVKIYKQKVAKGHSVTKKAECKLSLTSILDEDLGMEMVDYLFQGKIKSSSVNNAHHVEPESELGRAEFTRLTTRLFPVWSKAHTRIANFVQNLDPLKVYTKMELKDSAEMYGVARINDMCSEPRATNGRRVGYGHLFQVRGETYRLFPSLVPSFRQHFDG
jgi:hypothetical protein